jgi:hypothetical protein
MIDESKKMFGKPEPEPPRPTPTPTTGRGAKIEAWLSETPDPFLDEVENKSDLPAPLDLKSGRARRSKRLADGDQAGTESEPSVISESRPRSAVSRHSRGKESISSIDKPSKQELDTGKESKRSSIDNSSKSSTGSKEEKPVQDKPYEESTLGVRDPALVRRV